MNKKEETEKQVISRIERCVASKLSERGVKRVVAGVSGGADSVALLYALQRIGAEVKALHCNFHLRGEESMRDMDFVRNLCLILSVPLETVDFDVAAYRKRHGGSVEMACRDLRYDWFEKKRAEWNADRIAVAHNSDDNAETVLLNLFRGAGVAGLRGMKWDTGRVIRPLLEVSRKEIETYLEAVGQSFVIDSTNLQSDYRRNFLRNDVIPLIEKEWPNVKGSINHTAAIMKLEEEGSESMVEDLIEAESILYSVLKRPKSGRWLLRKFVVRRGGSDKIVNEIAASLEKGVIRKGARWVAPGGEFIFGIEALEWVERVAGDEKEMRDSFLIECHRNSSELLREIKADGSNSTFWTSLSPEEIDIREWHEGDRIKPLGMKGSRLVSDILREAKLPYKIRRKLAVIQERKSGEVLWVEGLKRSRKALVNPDATQVISIKRK